VSDGDSGGTAAATPEGGTQSAADSGATTAGCTRDLLKNTVAAYFTALAAHSASTLPLAGNVKFTENGKVLTVGQDGLWQTAGALVFSINAYDTDGCNTATEAVVPDGTTQIPFALRLKLVNQQITEIETIAVRSGDYSVTSDPNAIVMSDSTVHWEDSVADAGPNTAQDMNSWMTKYFADFPNGVCNTSSSCIRLENGGGSFGCATGAGCNSGAPSGTPVIQSHAIFSDVETGIGAGFDSFMGSYCDMHIFKMYGGTVYAVHAILGKCSSTGWD